MNSSLTATLIDPAIQTVSMQFGWDVSHAEAAKDAKMTGFSLG